MRNRFLSLEEDLQSTEQTVSSASSILNQRRLIGTAMNTNYYYIPVVGRILLKNQGPIGTPIKGKGPKGKGKKGIKVVFDHFTDNSGAQVSHTTFRGRNEFITNQHGQFFVAFAMSRGHKMSIPMGTAHLKIYLPGKTKPLKQSVPLGLPEARKLNLLNVHFPTPPPSKLSSQQWVYSRLGILSQSIQSFGASHLTEFLGIWTIRLP